MQEQVPTGDPFARSRQLFESMITELDSAQTAQLTHAQIEERITTSGRELHRSMYQDHLDLRAVREADHHDVIGADGIQRTRTETGHGRKLTTVFGEVSVERRAYRALGALNLHPADATLNLPAERHSHGLRKLAALEAARGSLEDAAQAISRATGTAIGKRQTEQLAARAAVDVTDFYEARERRACPADDVLAISADGKGIVMRPGSLREQTARAANNSGNKLATRLSRVTKRPYLNYAHALSSGWPIATGVIEGACRHLVKDRMDITGARWGLPGADAVLKLRALVSNGDFDDYWDYHLTQEHQRVHRSRHIGGLIPGEAAAA